MQASFQVKLYFFHSFFLKHRILKSTCCDFLRKIEGWFTNVGHNVKKNDFDWLFLINFLAIFQQSSNMALLITLCAKFYFEYKQDKQREEVNKIYSMHDEDLKEEEQIGVLDTEELPKKERCKSIFCSLTFWLILWICILTFIMIIFISISNHYLSATTNKYPGKIKLKGLSSPAFISREKNVKAFQNKFFFEDFF